MNRIGFGDLTDQQLQNDAIALLDHLQSNGCTDGFDASVQTFQQSYVSAGGALPNDSGGRSGIDGLYGKNTAAALQAVMNANPGNSALTNMTAPAGCVAAAPGGAGGGGGNTVFNNGQSATTVSTASMLPTWGWFAIGAAVIAGAAMIYESAQHPHALRSAHRGMKGHAHRLIGHRRGRARRRR
jgi:hypothetical protein